MNKFDTAPYSFRLNLTRDEELEIHRFLNSDIVKIHYGDKSKFIKKALIYVFRLPKPFLYLSMSSS